MMTTTTLLLNLKPGDVVRVGPAYRGGNRYEADGCEGEYTVQRALPPGDYYLVKGLFDVEDVEHVHWDLICHASRLTLVE